MQVSIRRYVKLSHLELTALYSPTVKSNFARPIKDRAGCYMKLGDWLETLGISNSTPTAKPSVERRRMMRSTKTDIQFKHTVACRLV